LLAASSASALSLFHICLLAWTVALLLGCRRGLLSGIPPWEQPVLGLGLLLLLLLRPRLVLWDRGRGAGRGEVPLTVHDRQRPENGYYHQTRTTPQGKIILKKSQSPCRAKNDSYAGCYP